MERAIFEDLQNHIQEIMSLVLQKKKKNYFHRKRMKEESFALLECKVFCLY